MAGSERAATAHRAVDARILEPNRRAKDDCHIIYGFAHGPVGTLLIARTSRGVCRIACVNTKTKTAAIAALRLDRPGATLDRDDDAIRALLPAILQATRGNRRGRPIPLDVRGTPFQRRVWQELLEINAGATTSYSRLARSLGNPGAARAVGNAVGHNPIGVLIPCHRVIREDGTIGGFAWGPAVKRKLLAWESLATASGGVARKKTRTAGRSGPSGRPSRRG